MSRNARLPVTIVKYGGNNIIVNIKKGTGFQLSIRQLKPRLSLCPIIKDMDNPTNQSKLEVAGTKCRKMVTFGVGCYLKKNQ